MRTCNCTYVQCNPYDAGHVGYTGGELVDGHKQKSSTTWKHYFGEHNSNEPPCLSDQFQVIIKCSNKFDCLIKATCLRRKLNHPKGANRLHSLGELVILWYYANLKRLDKSNRGIMYSFCLENDATMTPKRRLLTSVFASLYFKKSLKIN